MPVPDEPEILARESRRRAAALLRRCRICVQTTRPWTRRSMAARCCSAHTVQPIEDSDSDSDSEGEGITSADDATEVALGALAWILVTLNHSTRGFREHECAAPACSLDISCADDGVDACWRRV
jgi:hypothetical protein